MGLGTANQGLNLTSECKVLYISVFFSVQSLLGTCIPFLYEGKTDTWPVIFHDTSYTRFTCIDVDVPKTAICVYTNRKPYSNNKSLPELCLCVVDIVATVDTQRRFGRARFAEIRRRLSGTLCGPTAANCTVPEFPFRDFVKKPVHATCELYRRRTIWGAFLTRVASSRQSAGLSNPRGKQDAESANKVWLAYFYTNILQPLTFQLLKMCLPAFPLSWFAQSCTRRKCLLRRLRKPRKTSFATTF